MIINVMKKITILLLLVVSSNVFALKDSDSRKYDECIIESNKDVDHDRNTAKSAEKLCYQKFIETYETAPSASEEQRLTSQNQNSSASDVSYVTFQYENQASDQAKADGTSAKAESMAKKEKICGIKANTYLFAADGRDNGFTPKQALGHMVQAKDEQDWKMKIDDFEHSGVPLAWMKEAINQVYFDPRFINARGNGFFMQMLNLCLFGSKRYEPLK